VRNLPIKARCDEKQIAELASFKQASVQAEDLAGMIERISGAAPYSRKAQEEQSLLAIGWGEVTTMMVGTKCTRQPSTLLRERCRPSVITWKRNMPSLQQNNSAIAEQVESRDLIIDELNDRVAVLEDKVVLGSPSTTAEGNER
jgi:hypothetical protein